MTEIDELVGVELAEAVAIARGFEKSVEGPPYYYALNANGRWCHRWGVDKLTLWGSGTHISNYRPDRDIAQAWALDDEWWGWNFAELGLGKYRRVEAEIILIRANDDSTHDRFMSVAYFLDFPTKAHAYATARCRAYLKAKEAL